MNLENRTGSASRESRGDFWQRLDTLRHYRFSTIRPTEYRTADQ